MKWNNKFTYPKSTRSIINGSRHYALDGSNLPSVTTILKATQNEENKAAIPALSSSLWVALRMVVTLGKLEPSKA